MGDLIDFPLSDRYGSQQFLQLVDLSVRDTLYILPCHEGKGSPYFSSQVSSKSIDLTLTCFKSTSLLIYSFTKI